MSLIGLKYLKQRYEDLGGFKEQAAIKRLHI